MKNLSLPFVVIFPLALTSCGLLQSAVQLPVRTMQSLGRSVGVGIEQSESNGQQAPVKFEQEVKPAR